jgi:hypothetical protein
MPFMMALDQRDFGKDPSKYQIVEHGAYPTYRKGKQQAFQVKTRFFGQLEQRGGKPIFRHEQGLGQSKGHGDKTHLEHFFPIPFFQHKKECPECQDDKGPYEPNVLHDLRNVRLFSMFDLGIVKPTYARPDEPTYDEGLYKPQKSLGQGHIHSYDAGGVQSVQ